MEDTQPIQVIRRETKNQRIIPLKGKDPKVVNSFSVLYALKNKITMRQLGETLSTPWPISWVIGLTTIFTCVLLLLSSSMAYAVLLLQGNQH